MSNMISFAHEPSVGFHTREMRVRLGLTQQELARTVGVSEEDIKLLERNLPIELGFKIRALKFLWEQTAIQRNLKSLLEQTTIHK